MNLPLTFSCASDLHKKLEAERISGNRIGFVPTMGALHRGHLDLVLRAIEENDRVVISIFVNPTQFNNSIDLEKYPRTLDKDLQLLADLPKVVVFHPVKDEVYPEEDKFQPIDLNGLDEVMEGTYRPGHFQGVVHVVHNLFQIVKPDNAYFGLKDYQQLAIIKWMVKKLDLRVSIVECETRRESSGLALSSRNLRLSDKEKEDSTILYSTLKHIQTVCKNLSPSEAKLEAISFFNRGKLELEYLEIVDPVTLKELDSWKDGAVCCIAAYCGEVRLIDNMIIC